MQVRIFDTKNFAVLEIDGTPLVLRAFDENGVELHQATFTPAMLTPT